MKAQNYQNKRTQKRTGNKQKQILRNGRRSGTPTFSSRFKQVEEEERPSCDSSLEIINLCSTRYSGDVFGRASHTIDIPQTFVFMEILLTQHLYGNTDVLTSFMNVPLSTLYLYIAFAFTIDICIFARISCHGQFLKNL